MGKHHGYDTTVKGKVEGFKDTSRSSTSFGMSDSAVRICLPSPLKDIPEKILHRKAYIVSYNKDTRNSNWLAWHLTGEHANGPYGRSNDFYEIRE